MGFGGMKVIVCGDRFKKKRQWIRQKKKRVLGVEGGKDRGAELILKCIRFPNRRGEKNLKGQHTVMKKIP